MRYLAMLVLILMFTGCARHFYSSTKSLPKDAMSIDVDTTFRFFTRKVFKDTSNRSEGKRLVTNYQSIKSSAKDLLEIDYLLISQTNKKVIYITTIPDPIQLYYKDHPVRESELNIENFNRFHFGIVHDGTHVSFTDKADKLRNTWVIGYGSDSGSLHLERLIQKQKSRNGGDFQYSNEISVDEALEQPITFIEEPSFHFRLVRTNTDGAPPELADDKIYFTRRGRKFKIYFNLNKSVPGKNEDRVVFFSNNRVHFSPVPLVSNEQ